MSSRQMVMVAQSPSQRGTSLIEVLVTLVVLSIGLLGLVKLQGVSQIASVETYQRAQALMLLDDMSNRLANNPTQAANYVTTNPLGAGMTCPTAMSTRQEMDSAEWCHALQGASETQQSGSTKLGGVINGRGCIDDLGTNRYLITVAWQGLTPVAAPPASIPCARNAYDDGNKCARDVCRRVVTTVVQIPTL